MKETNTPLHDLSLRELSDLATPEAWHPYDEGSESPYITAGKAATAAETLTRPVIMTGLWPIHERAQTEAAERTTFANTHFVCALVNAYRRGELVHSETTETVAIPIGVAKLIRKVFLPTNPNKCRTYHPDTLSAVRAFIAAVEGK